MLSPQSINHILKRKRKGRAQRPCYPCRQRKVKCDASRPCKNCVERSHEELCSYEPGSASPTTKYTPSRYAVLTTRTGGPESSDNQPAYNNEISTEGPVQSKGTAVSVSGVLLGEQSVPSFIAENYQSNDPSAAKMKDAALPMLGLQSPYDASLPPWKMEDGEAQKILDILPAKDQILELFTRYRHVVHPLNPFLVDIHAFELKLCNHLESMPDQNQSIKPPQSFRYDLDWAALLFAVSASGMQSASTQTPDSKIKIRRYVSAAYQCLCISQALIKPSINGLQALIIVVQVLQNELLTEAAWTLLGLLSRQAQSLGLHNIQLDPQGQTPLHLKLWWTIIWQDSLLCMCFDRAPITAVKSTDPFHTLLALKDPLNYQEGMYALSYLALITRSKNHSLISRPPTYEEILTDVNDIEKLRSSLRVTISAPKNCKSMQDHIEQLCFQLHSSFGTGTILRPSLSPKNWTYLSQSQRAQLTSRCLEAYKSSLNAYLDLLATSIVARRSLAMLHNGLASALILAITGYSKVDQEVAQLQKRLFQTLYSETDSEATENRFWGPHRRGLLALKEMYDHQNSVQNITILARSQSPSNMAVPTIQQSQPGLPPVSGPYRTNTEFLSEFPSYDYSVFDPQVIGDISFLPDNSNENELMIDDIFDAVLWGDYDSQNSYPSGGLI